MTVSSVWFMAERQKGDDGIHVENRRRRIMCGRWALVCGLVVGVGGCSALGPCDRSDGANPADPYREGTVEDGWYMSSAWTGSWLPFPGGQRYALYHGLGCVPRAIECWVSFSGGGTGEGSMAPAAGNMCLVQDVDGEKVVVKNDTCSDMNVLIVAGGCESSG